MLLESTPFGIKIETIYSNSRSPFLSVTALQFYIKQEYLLPMIWRFNLIVDRWNATLWVLLTEETAKLHIWCIFERSIWTSHVYFLLKSMFVCAPLPRILWFSIFTQCFGYTLHMWANFIHKLKPTVLLLRSLWHPKDTGLTLNSSFVWLSVSHSCKSKRVTLPLFETMSMSTLQIKLLTEGNARRYLCRILVFY